MSTLTVKDKFLLLLNYDRLLVKMGKVDPEYATVKDLCEAFKVNKNYIKNLRDKFLERGTFARKQGSGRPYMINYDERVAAVTNVIRKRRSISIHDISQETAIPTTSVQRIINDEEFRLVPKRTCPFLTDDQKSKRLKWCRQHRYNTWDNYVDIDEKLFELYSFNRERYRDSSPRKKVPLVSKVNIPKLMIITAVAKPNPENSFNGLIGIWRIQEDYEARRSSKNHTKGDAYKIDCTMTSTIFYEMMCNEIMPAVSDKMCWCKNVYIQMDNARPHIGKNNVQKLNDFGDSIIPTITVTNQPAQSPELNVNDIGFFHSLSKRCQKNMCTNLDELWTVLQAEFWSTNEQVLTCLFTTKSRTIHQIIASKGAPVNISHK